MFRKKIGILGGTFNPIHNGHLLLAQNALEYCELDKVLMMPSAVSYLKDPNTIANTNDRAHMVKLAIENNPRLELSEIEIKRGGNSYTYVTLEQLSEECTDTDFYYIIGADTLFSMEKWVKPEIIFSKSTIVCAPRDESNVEELYVKSNELKNKYNADIIVMNIPEVKISSSYIRNAIKSGKSGRYYLPESVREYIKDKHLYTS